VEWPRAEWGAGCGDHAADADVGVVAGFVEPQHQRLVAPVEAVAESALGGGDIDSLAAQHLADAHGEHRAAVAQPGVARVGVAGEDLLHDVVDVVGHGGDHLLGGEGLEMVSGRLAEQLFDAVVEEAGLSDPVGADQQRCRNVLLGEPAGVVHRGRRSGRGDRRRTIGEGSQRNIDVLADARLQAGRRVLDLQRRDGAFDDGLDVPGHGVEPLCDGAGHGRDQRSDPGIVPLH